MHVCRIPGSGNWADRWGLSRGGAFECIYWHDCVRCNRMKQTTPCRVVYCRDLIKRYTIESIHKNELESEMRGTLQELCRKTVWALQNMIEFSTLK